MRPPSTAELLSSATDTMFGRPLVTNSHRGLLAEAIVNAALAPTWRWCAGDWASWDFEHPDGLKLEVKQSAARQSWSDGSRPSSASFDIAARKGYWSGDEWVACPGRAADIYIFAYHPIWDDTADHRVVEQWLFHVVPSPRLPPTKRLTLPSLAALASGIGFEALNDEVARMASRFRSGEQVRPPFVETFANASRNDDHPPGVDLTAPTEEVWNAEVS